MSTIQAQKESENLRGIVKAETRKRKNWAVIDASVLSDWAKEQAEAGVFGAGSDGASVIPTREVLIRRFFGTRADAPVRTSADETLIAVWRKLPEKFDDEGKPVDYAPQADDQPSFLSDPPKPAPEGFAFTAPEKRGFWARLFGKKPEPEAPMPAITGPIALCAGHDTILGKDE